MTMPRQYRERADLTREQLAVKAGVTARTVQNLEDGRGCLTSVLVKVAHALGLTRGEYFKAWDLAHRKAGKVVK